MESSASARARSASRLTDSRNVGAFSARVRKASSAVRSRLAVAALAAGIKRVHETAHIFERLAECKGLDQCQNVALP
jgi:hypothetical protein